MCTIKRQPVKGVRVIGVLGVIEALQVSFYFKGIKMRNMTEPFSVDIVPVLFRIGMTSTYTPTPNTEEPMLLCRMCRAPWEDGEDRLFIWGIKN